MSDVVRDLLKQLGARGGLGGLALTTAAALPARGAPWAAGGVEGDAASGQGLPHLQPGEVHEWFSLDELEAPTGAGRKQWAVPLTLLTLLAGRAAGGGARRVLFIGRSCWPTFQLVCAALQEPGHEPAAAFSTTASRWRRVGAGTDALRRCLFLEPLTPAERFWAIGEALRCAGVAAVVADGSGMDETVSRRLQLAAEAGARKGRSGEGAGGVLCLLARPRREMNAPSWASTRWSVRAAPSPCVETRRWAVVLVGCRRQPVVNTSLSGWEGELAQDARPQWMLDWTYQVLRGTGTLHISPGLGCRTAAAPGAPPPPAAHPVLPPRAAGLQKPSGTGRVAAARFRSA